jgi:hypothetical protein
MNAGTLLLSLQVVLLTAEVGYSLLNHRGLSSVAPVHTCAGAVLVAVLVECATVLKECAGVCCPLTQTACMVLHLPISPLAGPTVVLTVSFEDHHRTIIPEVAVRDVYLGKLGTNKCACAWF